MFLRAREEKIIGVTSEQKVNIDKKDKEENLEQKIEKPNSYKDEEQRNKELIIRKAELLNKLDEKIKEMSYELERLYSGSDFSERKSNFESSYKGKNGRENRPIEV